MAGDSQRTKEEKHARARLWSGVRVYTALEQEAVGERGWGFNVKITTDSAVILFWNEFRRTKQKKKPRKNDK